MRFAEVLPSVLAVVLLLSGGSQAPPPHSTPQAVDCQTHAEHSWPTFPWLPAGTETLERRIFPPDGFRRLVSGDKTFASWLRTLPVKAGHPPVHLYDGRLKGNQDAHYAVLDIDTGSRNLQQCADALIRLRAEFLRSIACEDAIQFRFTSGHVVPWQRWKNGERPVVSGAQVSWRNGGAADSSYPTFRRYLDQIFAYAGTASLQRELLPVSDPSRPVPGDIYIHGGAPGHAVMVMDVCIDAAEGRMCLLAQSYMPAQDIHILVNPASPGSPWYQARSSGALQTPEWTFDYGDLRRFPPSDCENR